MFPSNKLTFTTMDEPPAAPKGPVPVPSAPVAHLNTYLLTHSHESVPHMSFNHVSLSCPIRSHPHPLLNWDHFSCFRAHCPFSLWLCSGSSRRGHGGWRSFLPADFTKEDPYENIYIFTYIHRYIYTYSCVYIHIYICTHIQTYTYTFTFTYA